jgi:hypothetical protein
LVTPRDFVGGNTLGTNPPHLVHHGGARPVVAAEEHDAADGGLAQEITVGRRQGDAFDIEHDRSESHLLTI